MTIRLGNFPPVLDEQLLDRLRNISFPTIGHYLESGFCDTAIQRVCGQGKVIGQAVTVRLTPQDSTLLHHTVSQLREHDVLVIDMNGDVSHAPVGLVVATAAKLRKSAGIVIDGVVTDVDEVHELNIPIFARGKSILTTKLLGQSEGSLNEVIVCGGVSVSAGDIVLGDSNGVCIFPRETIVNLLATIEEDDALEPELIAKLHQGKKLGDETGASHMIEQLSKE